jgi:DNA-binding SARP family transcriptional activator/predicted ATPase
MTPFLDIRLLGSLRITLDRAAVGPFMSVKVPALLAYLAVTGRPQRRDDLAALLWGELPDADARNNLRQAIANLRRSLDAHLVITRDDVALNAKAPFTLDVAAFEERLRAERDLGVEARSGRLRDALALYTGDFLAGFFVRDAPVFEEWMLAQRMRYRELALHALHTLTQLRLDQGEYDLAIEDATRLLAQDEWREEAHYQLMLALARTGRRSAALAQYQRCRRLLGEEFGAEPAAATTALYTRIKLALAGPRHNLPAITTGFVGREREIAELRRLLSAAENRLITVLGAGGAGKTRLACEAAKLCEPAFLNGVWFVSLTPPPTGRDGSSALAQAIANALGCPLTGPHDPHTQLAAYLRPRELLLVVDNLEEWGEAAAWLCELLAGAPDIKVLATSRQRLDLQAERVFPLAGLPCPPAGAVDPGAFAAAQLFTRRAQRVRPDFELTTPEHFAVARICRAVEGLPLGIELAAAWAHQLSPDEIAAEIERSLDFLATSRRDVSARQRSLRAVFDWSWGRLSHEEQTVFARLAVFHGPFSRAAASEVAAAAPGILAALADKSLLWRRGATYQMHEVARRFAEEKLAQTGAGASARSAHAAWYAGFLSRQEARLKGRDQQAALEEIESELENARAAWLALVESREISGLALATGGLYHFCLLRSHFREGLEAFRGARLSLEAPAAGDTWGSRPAEDTRALTYGRVMAREARFHSATADYGEAERLLKASLEILTALDAPGEVAFVLGHLGGTARLQGELEPAERHLTACLTLRRQTGDNGGEAIALLELAGVAFARENYAIARQHCEEGLAASESAGDLQTTAHLLTGLSLCQRELGQYQAAETCVRRSLALYEELGDRYGVLQACLTLGELYRQLGNTAAARHFCQRAVSVAREIGDRSGEADGYYRLGQIAAGLDEREEALRELRAALEQAYEIGEILMVLDVLLEIACLPTEVIDARLANDILRVLLDEPRLTEQRRDRARTVLARLSTNVRIAGGRTAGLDQLVPMVLRLSAP